MKAPIYVITAPVSIEITCPKCKHENEMSYDEFSEVVADPENCDGSIIPCSECDCEIQIAFVNYR